MVQRRKPLVCQYIESLSGEALERYADMIRRIVGRRHGVYALYRRDKLYYVGLATNLRSRLRAHRRDRHKGLWDRFSVYLTLEHNHLKELESLVIRIAQPKGNKQGGRFARAENLTKVLKRHWQEQQRAEWIELTGTSDDEDGDDATPRKHRSKKKKKAGRSPTLAPFVTGPMKLRRVYKGKLVRARVRKDGTVRYNRALYNSPSLAAVAAIGRPANGWYFWHYERAPGQWVPLAELRKR